MLFTLNAVLSFALRVSAFLLFVLTYIVLMAGTCSIATDGDRRLPVRVPNEEFGGRCRHQCRALFSKRRFSQSFYFTRQLVGWLAFFGPRKREKMPSFLLSCWEYWFHSRGNRHLETFAKKKKKKKWTHPLRPFTSWSRLLASLSSLSCLAINLLPHGMLRWQGENKMLR